LIPAPNGGDCKNLCARVIVCNSLHHGSVLLRKKVCIMSVPIVASVSYNDVVRFEGFFCQSHFGECSCSADSFVECLDVQNLCQSGHVVLIGTACAVSVRNGVAVNQKLFRRDVRRQVGTVIQGKLLSHRCDRPREVQANAFRSGPQCKGFFVGTKLIGRRFFCIQMREIVQ